MKRALLTHLETWITSPDRKPLVIRGARQVGKTWLVRQLATDCNKQLIELNFEKQPSLADAFNSNDIQQILFNLSVIHNQTIEPEKTLLFLDEIQATPQLLSKLRWFAEDLPALPVIAAGSLLEFVLDDHAFSMPVGRINYLHLEPLSFEEFLLAHDKNMLFEYLKSFNFTQETPGVIHEQLMTWFKEYMLIGGMPAAVLSWVTERSLNKVNQIQHDLLATYRDDFAKYKGRIAIERFEEVLTHIPRLLGQKVVYRRINPNIQINTLKQVLDLLSKARICHTVWSCAANGVPLATELNEKFFKTIFLDVGLCSAALGLNLKQIYSLTDLILINNGGLAEQVTGQLLRTIHPAYIEPALYYWLREERTTNAEIDYVIQHHNQVIPLEVKAGSTGSLKSLHVFMGLKKLSLAVRVNADLPMLTPVSVKNHAGELVEYRLLSIPFYLIGQLSRLLEE